MLELYIKYITNNKTLMKLTFLYIYIHCGLVVHDGVLHHHGFSILVSGKYIVACHL